jgi:hypothetical protein
MSEPFQTDATYQLNGHSTTKRTDSERALKNFRYVMGSVNADALKTWTELWNELQAEEEPILASQSRIKSRANPAFNKPACLEKLYVLKQYLDYVHRLCK